MTTTMTPRARERWMRPALVERPPGGEHRVTVSESVADIVEVWGRDSFPASDPPANW
jgi:hypothetical protein